MDNRGEVWKTFIVLVPELAAALVAVSRIMDARHHPFDVISGAMLGQFMAWVAYRQYFPPLTEPKKKGHAYPPRTWTMSSQEVVADTEYSAARMAEEGRLGSSESLGSEGRTRKRAQPAAGPHGSTPSSTMRSQSDQFEMVAHVGGHGPNPLPHRDPTWEGGVYRDSMDVGDTRGQEFERFNSSPPVHRGEN
jgi:hypothetical protein